MEIILEPIFWIYFWSSNFFNGFFIIFLVFKFNIISDGLNIKILNMLLSDQCDKQIILSIFYHFNFLNSIKEIFNSAET